MTGFLSRPKRIADPTGSRGAIRPIYEADSVATPATAVPARTVRQYTVCGCDSAYVRLVARPPHPTPNFHLLIEGTLLIQLAEPRLPKDSFLPTTFKSSSGYG
ncbi:hypothetical protein TSMEX_006207 [Taenia solium]|eukprot:TsM_000125000 transcript=TsM_000125000 gene=TsM_000125000